MRARQSAGERLLVARNCDQVNVVRHEAIAEQSETVQPCVPRQAIQIAAVVARGEEDLLAIVAALSDRVRRSSDDYAGAARHGDNQ
jgi:hypothetical protein